MKINQLSVFVENKPGQLLMPCKALADAGINIVTLSLADTEQFGILRLIVGDWQLAKKVLEAAGCVVNVTELLAIEVEDHPGGLAQVLQALEATDVNIEYMYAFTEKLNERSVLVFRFDDPDKALEKLASTDINLVSQIDLYQRK